MYRSSTTTSNGNSYYIHYCKRCGFDKAFCLCWINFMGFLEKIIYLKLKLEIYKCFKIMTKGVSVIHLVRRTQNSISGMKGVALLKRIDKR